MDCIFCKIASGEISSDLVYQDDDVVAFRDLHPQAPHHILIIPREHVATLNDFDKDHQQVLGGMLLAAQKIAADLGVASDGYRVAVNCNGHGGQTVFHTHMHFLAGRQMGWPPG